MCSASFACINLKPVLIADAEEHVVSPFRDLDGRVLPCMNFILKNEVADFSEILVPIYQNALRHI